MKRRAATSRSALTLLEVVLALAILAGSLATLSQLVGLGIRAASESRDLTQGQLLAESVMSEIVSGILPAENLNQVPMNTHPGWVVSAIIDTTIHQGVLQVTVVAARDSERYRAVRYQLSRWMRDPNLAIPTEDEDPADESDDSQSDSDSSDSTDDTGGAATPRGNTPSGNLPAGSAPPGNVPPSRAPTPPPSGNVPPRNVPLPGAGGAAPRGGPPTRGAGP